MQQLKLFPEVPFSETWYEELNDLGFGRESEGTYRSHKAVAKIAEAVRDMLKAKSESLTVTQILDRIDPTRYHCIFAGHLGEALRDLEIGIEYQLIPPKQRNKQGDVYRYSYRKGRTAYREANGKLWENSE